LQNVAVQAFEPNGSITFWNKASERVYGYSAADAMGKDIIELLHTPATRAHERKLIADALKGSHLPEPEEIEAIRRDGSTITICTTRILHRRPGCPPEFFRFDVDATDKKRSEHDLAHRQAELLHTSRLSTLGQMVAALSHELAQPLTAIGNYASASCQLVERASPGREKLQNFIEGIAQQSQRCIAILQRLRDFSRRTQPRRSSCDVRQLVHDSVELMATELRRRNVTLHTEFADALPLIIADRIQIEQVIVNLLTNALDAVRSQPATNRLVRIRTYECDPMIHIAIDDNGPGLTPETRSRLFEPFFTTKPEGMGIGLNICDSIIRQHGGQIEARNNEQGGATFTIQMPLVNRT
jgi:two-component system sensor histidine kinase DctS